MRGKTMKKAEKVPEEKSKGSFILKIFDMFTKSTDDYIYLLSLFYNKVYIIKPQTSRLANSEKYIVCKEFKTFTKSNMNSYLQLFNKIIIAKINNFFILK